MKVLIVDDSESVRKMLRQQLLELGCDVFEAESGYDALEHLATVETPHMVFVDRQMPGMDGIQFIATVRNQPRFDKMRIVMCSGPLPPEQACAMPLAAIDCFIPKPLAREAVASAIGRLALAN